MSSINFYIKVLFLIIAILVLEHLISIKLSYKFFYFYIPFFITPFSQECPNTLLNQQNNLNYSEEIRNNIIEKRLSKNPKFLNITDGWGRKSYENFTRAMGELMVIETNKCLVRVGSKNDGGYLLLNHELDKVEVLYSYGIEYDTYFERMFSDRFGSKVYMYDNTIYYVPYHPNFYHFKENVGILPKPPYLPPGESAGLGSIPTFSLK